MRFGQPYPVLVVVLVVEHPLALRVTDVVPRRGDVDEQTSRCVNPPRVNHVQPVIRLPVQEVRVHLEHEVAALRHAVVLVVPCGHVMISGKEEQVSLADLDIRVEIPRHDLADTRSDLCASPL